MLDGDPAARDFTAVWHRRDRPVAALLVGRPRELPGMRRLIQQTLEQHALETTP
ncbi:hypothetical protein FSW04_05375 [Baekduia soli]|uniref:Reductase C-terminal domain-containing protein n=1 Tax=Baekduia soli TaxID=496014 RepID=A0A5B8U2D0_9ACTN|nr:hypothetical protein [Baekduia soli]QEC47072.1 hypothetical protein FSW04_05375 [Baekduia soli]